MKYVNIKKIANRYNIKRIAINKGAGVRFTTPENPKLGKLGAWIGINENDELVLSYGLRGAMNSSWTDQLAHDYANGLISKEELL